MAQMAQFSNRNSYFSNAGIKINDEHGRVDALTAMKIAGLDYIAEKRPLYLYGGEGENPVLFENAFGVVKTDDETQIGVVGKDYKVVQNAEGFNFLQEVLDYGAIIETAGHFDNFGKTFILVKTDSIKVLDDKIDPYLLFSNSFNGSSGVQAMFTPIRVICKNTLALAIKEAVNKITIRHSSNAIERLTVAQDILKKQHIYLNKFKGISEKLAVTPFSEKKYNELVVPTALKQLKLLDENGNLKDSNWAEDIQDSLLQVYKADDLQNYNNTAYKALQAIADFESHYEPGRDTGNPYIYMQRILAGMVVYNAVAKMIQDQFGFKF